MPIDLPSFTSDEDAGSISDASLGLLLGDVSTLEDVLDRNEDSLTTDTPLTQFSPNLPCPTQERVVYSPKHSHGYPINTIFAQPSLYTHGYPINTIFAQPSLSHTRKICILSE